MALACADCGGVECADTCPSLIEQLVAELDEERELPCRCEAEALRMDPRTLPRQAGCCARTVYQS